KKLGFDDVVEVSGGAEIISEKTRKLCASGELKTPIISSACPTIVELVAMRFQSLKEHLIPVLAPIDVAAKIAKEKAAEKTGLDKKEIGVFFISPCPAKVFAVRNKLGVKERIIDGVLAISDIYKRLLPEMKNIEEIEELSTSGRVGISWATIGGESAGSLHEKYLAADGIENCISVLKELEDGKMSEIDFVELNACPGGCVGGVLNIENPFVAKARMQFLRKYLPVSKSKLNDCVLSEEELMWEEEPQAVDSMRMSSNFMEAMRIMSEIESILKTLPGLDCGNCGAPSCRAFAEDVVMKNIPLSTCDRRKNENN
ncbi:MAG: ferredoxin, partial [Clostridia bacterium]|nr:ferredoxin [Clostridia bacterium]